MAKQLVLGIARVLAIMPTEKATISAFACVLMYKSSLPACTPRLYLC